MLNSFNALVALRGWINVGRVLITGVILQYSLPGTNLYIRKKERNTRRY